MGTLQKLSSDVVFGFCVSVGLLAVFVVVGFVAGWDRAAVSDLLFVISAVLFVVAVVMTRPTVSRRRAIQRQEGSEDDEHASVETDAEAASQRTGDPERQFALGVRTTVVAATLFCGSFLVQYL